MKATKAVDFLNPKMITVIITRKCTISCPMCFFGCTPDRKEFMPVGLVEDAITQISHLNVDTLGITGGEPFLEFDLMNKSVTKATFLGMTSIVVTNAHWASTKELALEKLSILRKSGLGWIQISLDDQHQQFISHRHVSNIVEAAQKLNFESIKIIGSSKRNSETFTYHLYYLQELLKVNLEDIELLDRPRVSHKNYSDDGQQRYGFSAFLNMEQHLLPQPDCLNEMMIDVNGDLYPCCNNFIGRIGNIAEKRLDKILCESKKNKYNKLIGMGGPVQLALYLDKTHGTDFTSQSYATWCEICARIFQNDAFREILAS